ncbi:type VI secretion system protein TssA [Xenorhabdus littoralis]|uniref:type VI secretion system protein TssA n=1 Tax=Xenorhabdus littoralis TaxID=2582835 RepID=UPI0029E7FBDB|nr:type VI secretion system protein TssA [Xenorhabdus sp. psl]MDX7990441.1 type VI secretion system protein TssA [Xenorhabdus sp. psl]
MNIDALLKPISAESPCGEDLEYDAEFMALEQSLFGKVDQQFGDIIIPAESPNWLQVEEQTISLLTRTKDLRVILALAQSWLELRGLRGYADGMDLLKKTLERYWEEVWPKLEFDGEYDPLFRLNILAAIEDSSPITLQVQHSVLLKSISKELSLQEVYSLLDGSISEISGYTGGRTRLLDELKQQINNPEILAVTHIRNHLIEIIDIISQKLSAVHAPELSRLLKNLNTVIEFCPALQSGINDSNTQEKSVAPELPHLKPSLGHEGSPSSTTPENKVSIYWSEIEANNRDEARMLLEKAKSYFLIHEPSHPAPMMISRIQRLIDRDFIDIVYDLAPEGLNQLEIIFGRPDNLDPN